MTEDPSEPRARRDVEGSDAPDEAGADEDRVVPEPSSAPIEAGQPDPENVLFVVLGAIAMVLVIIRLVSIGVAG